MNTKDTEATSTTVPSKARQVEDTYGRWPWVEPSIWSPRMLQALENGVKGGKWFSLMDKVWHPDNLGAAWLRAVRNGGSAGMDGQSIQAFTAHAGRELDRLHRELRMGTYAPQPVRRCWIPKPGGKEKRPLGIPIHQANCTSPQPVFGMGHRHSSLSPAARPTLSGAQNAPGSRT